MTKLFVRKLAVDTFTPEYFAKRGKLTTIFSDCIEICAVIGVETVNDIRTKEEADEAIRELIANVNAGIAKLMEGE